MIPIGEDDIQAYVDRRLYHDRQRLLEDYFTRNPNERARANALRDDLDVLRERLAHKLQDPIPTKLRVSEIQARIRIRRRGQLRIVAAAVAFLAIGAAGGWFAARPTTTAATNSLALVAFAATDAYRTFAVEAVHPVEVGVDQEAHLITWLSNRIGAQLNPPDLSAFGYSLVGGRILPGGGVTAAQLMYETEAGARMTVYLRPNPSAKTSFTFQRGEGLSSFVWANGGFDFAVTAELDHKELLRITTSIYKTLGSIEAGRREL